MDNPKSGKMLRFLRNWFALSVPLGLFLGRFIAVGQRRHTLKDQVRQRRQTKCWDGLWSAYSAGIKPNWCSSKVSFSASGAS